MDKNIIAATADSTIGAIITPDTFSLVFCDGESGFVIIDRHTGRVLEVSDNVTIILDMDDDEYVV